jgi:DNA-directed RNA polymerase subunit RPC12/RpoP
MYCGVVVVVHEAIQLAAGRVQEFTTAMPVKRTDSYSGCAGGTIGCGALAFLFAIAVLNQPGDKTCGGTILVLAVVFIIAGIASYGKTRESLTGFSGKCPYCETSVTIPPNTLGADCPACSKRIVFRDMKFISVDTPVSGAKKSQQ